MMKIKAGVMLNFSPKIRLGLLINDMLIKKHVFLRWVWTVLCSQQVLLLLRVVALDYLS